MAAAVAQQPVSAQVVGNAFVQQYYYILHHSPALVHQFYQDISKLGRPEDDGSMSITTTMKAINEKVLSLNYGEVRAEIKSIDAQESFNTGVHVLVTGYMTGKDDMMRNFAQSFFLAPQESGGYFVLNDMFRYLEQINNLDENLVENHVSVNEVDAAVNAEQGLPEAVPVQENHISEQTQVLDEEVNGEVHNLSDNGDVAIEEVPIAEVVDEVPDDSQLVIDSNIKVEEVPKKSYASIVMDLKDSALPFSSPTPALRRTPAIQVKQVTAVPSATPLSEVSVSSLDAAQNGNNQDGEADGYSIYIKGLPHNTTLALIEDEFKRFGNIKKGGIQVRSRQGFCFGFVEYEEANAVEKAIEASPITVGGRHAVVEEKRSTNSRGNGRGRFPAGRGLGFRNEGMRGRGNYAGGRGYNRGEFTGRLEFSNRGNNWGASSNRGGDGSHRAENVGTSGGRMNGVGGLASSGTGKNMATRVPATA